VHVEEGVRQLGLQTLNDGMAEGEVGHKLAVHHVQVKVVSAGIQQPPSGNHSVFCDRSSGGDPDRYSIPAIPVLCLFYNSQQCCGSMTFGMDPNPRIHATD
jgi:hypothetical protein